ncbi:MAG: sigma-70 family RNA polymerase sigma factor [Clostridia bacterium]|nr:sigma-70 family RNA polymerase sigma factor [Clostridia bacterium]
MSAPELEQIYAAYSGKVMGYIMARVQHRADAEDLCADVFEKVFRRINEYDQEKASLSTWIFTITRNTLIDHFRKSKPTEELDENLSDDTAVDASMLERETLGELAAALNQMPQELRDIVVLLYYDRKPMTEIAKLMHLSYGAVKLRHQKALTLLKRLLGA